MMLPSALQRIILLFALLVMGTTAELPIRLITHNIRYATTSPFKGEKPWADRKPLLLNELKHNTLYNPEAFICLQEVLHNQLVDVMGGLGDEWDYIGVGRDDGKEKGEYSPIIYRKGEWKVANWKTVWLSETPDKPGKGWDAASVRIVTVGTFVHQASNKTVVGMCTHFDDQGTKARTESAKLILKIIDEATVSTTVSRLPVFLGGDFNSNSNQSAYQILNSKDSSIQDAKELAKWRYGNTYTFTGFGTEAAQLIDFVFVGKDRAWDVKGYAVLENKFEDGVYNSDHRAVVGDVVLKV